MKIILRTSLTAALLLTVNSLPVISKEADTVSLSGPEKNFEKLWKMFHDRYAFFEIRGVDWQKQYETYRPKVTKKTTDGELFTIICDMLEPLKDGHVTLKRKGKKKFCPEPTTRFNQEFNDEQIKDLFRISGKTLAANDFDKMRTPVSILRYSVSKKFGYMRIVEFEGVKNKHLSTALDKIMHSFQGLEGVIVDIRDNPGGEDEIAYEIANRFVEEERIGHYKRTKTGPGETDFSQLKPWRLKPHRKPFTKPVVLICNDASSSAADVFALAMKQLPHVTLIGDPTKGIFSDMLEKKLPNGWKYSLSHQRYYSPDMICYEAKGVPIDVKVLNTKEDLLTGEDKVIVASLKLLEEKSMNNVLID